MPSRRYPAARRSMSCPSLPITSGMVPNSALASRKRVKFDLARSPFGAIEGVAAAAEFQAQRHRSQLQVSAHRVEQVAAIAFRKLVRAIAEHDEARRPGLHLSDVTQLDPLALGCRRRIGV